VEASQTRDYCVAKGATFVLALRAGSFARLAQIAFGFAEARRSLRKSACSG
jgi:hypothetical protein